MTENKSQIKDYLADIVQGVLLILWFLASEATEMDFIVTLTGGIFIFGILTVFLVIRRYLDNKKEMAKLKGDAEIEKTKVFYDSTRQLTSESEKKPKIKRSCSFFCFKKHLTRQHGCTNFFPLLVTVNQRFRKKQALTHV